MTEDALDRVEKKLAAEESAAESSYRRLVEQFAANADAAKVPDAEAMATLRTCGRKFSEFRADVAKERRCNELRATIKGKRAALKRVQKAEAAKADFHARQQKAHVAFREELQRVTLEVNQSRAAFAEIGKAAAELEEITGEEVLLPDDDEPETPEKSPAPTGRKTKRS